PPAKEAPAFRPLTPGLDLDVILAVREPRKALGGSVISYHNTKFSLADHRGNAVWLSNNSSVLVLTHIDGSISALYKGKRYSLAEFRATPMVEEPAKAPGPNAAPWRPPEDHPWKRRSYERQRRIQKAREAARLKRAQDTRFPLAAT
ncbi:MAG: hypothetical protein NUW23_05800, partial [Firmicutes bacterium]|nr:hypothetical protein [Bacillota bacterium]